ncbi:MAG: transglutaminase domain-containing protein [Planctomycetes bacterium]|nr:transglutaminase domain-containing protein [Planctomycetota bacterium]
MTIDAFPARACAALLLGCLLGCASGDASGPAASDASARVRRFEFDYAGAVTGLLPGASVRMWLPVATSDAHQDVELLARDVPGEARLTDEARFGDRLLYVEARADAAGEVPFALRYRVTRREVTPANAEAARDDGAAFLGADALVPVGGHPKEVLLAAGEPRGDALAKARALYDVVNARMTYDKPEGQPWGRGDASWACDAGFGNCTDFHSLFIALARGEGIPARFEIGFPLGGAPSGDVGGYHCWAWFLADGRWLPVDISEADKHPELTDYYFGHLTADRVTFSRGRDLLLEPRQAGPPLNFLVYPYVEVDGAPAGSLRKAFAYRDL